MADYNCSVILLLSPGNLIEIAQKESALYDQKDDVAPPLKVKKVPKPETVGKGWFDFQVYIVHDCRHNY